MYKQIYFFWFLVGDLQKIIHILQNSKLKLMASFSRTPIPPKNPQGSQPLC